MLIAELASGSAESRKNGRAGDQKSRGIEVWKVGMRIGMDLTAVWRHETGVIRYAVELSKELVKTDTKNRYTLFFGGEIHPGLVELKGQFDAVVSPFRGEVLCKNFWLPFRPEISSLDFLHFPVFPPPLWCGCRSGWTIHDATAWLYPETMKWQSLWYFKLLGTWAARNGVFLLTVSQAAKVDIVKALRVQENQVSVAYQGLRSLFRPIEDRNWLEAVRQKYQLPACFILFVGTLEPRKNIAGLLRAFRFLKSQGDFPAKLVIVGRKGWLFDPIFSEMNRDELLNAVILTGFVTDEELVAIYNLARLMVFPSLYEGFGLPPLEAMACGCPVVVSNRGAMLEATGEAAIHVDPESTEELSEAIRLLYCDDDLRLRLSTAGIEHARQFTWAAAAKNVAAFFERAAGQNN